MRPLDLIDDIVIFDMDGTLNKYDFKELGFKIMEEHEWVRMNMQIDAYEFAEKTTLFGELIEKKNPMDMYVLSCAGCSFEQNNKINFIMREYPNIREEHIVFVAQSRYKVDIIKELREIYDKSHKQDKRIVIIEDNIGVLQDIENLHNDRIKCYLVSDFI